MTADEILHLFKLMLSYLPPTLKLFGFTLLYSIPLGMVVALLKMCKFKPVSWLTNLYILIMRGTPLLLQIIVVYYSVPTIRSNPHCPAFLQNLLNGVELRGDAGVVYMFRMILLAFVLNYAAYFAEIFRGGIESIPKGQYEAAAMLGFSKLQTFFRIILPQVIKRILPSVTNEVITLVKDTSLAFVVAVSEMFTIAKQIASAQTTMMPFVIAAVFYFVFNLLVAIVMDKIEKKLNYYR